MEIKQVKCSGCGAILSVRNSKDEDEKLIICPQCKVRLKVTFRRRQSADLPLDARTYVASFPQSGGETQLGGTAADGSTQLDGKDSCGKSALLELNGTCYQLSLGKNIVGRKAATSTATVQLATDDRYMSRQHVVINVVRMHDGNIKSIISNYQNKNSTLINGEVISAGDEIVLTDGAIIHMGHRQISYAVNNL